jgi:hypothetical protein
MIMADVAKATAGRVPASISFGLKILRIPSLAEMGIPMAGYGICRLSERLGDHSYDTCWINRGDPLLEYEFRWFEYETSPFLAAVRGDPLWHETFRIVSPISGLLLSTRREQTIAFASGVGLQYQCCDEPRLPVILVPNDEPLSSSDNFYVYDDIASHLRNNFEKIPIQAGSKTSRLREYIARYGVETASLYREHLSALEGRVPDSHRSYHIKEITAADSDLISIVQHLRSRDIDLRDKLVHIARKYGKAI